MYRLEDYFFKANGIVGFGGHLNLFSKFFLVKNCSTCNKNLQIRFLHIACAFIIIIIFFFIIVSW